MGNMVRHEDSRTGWHLTLHHQLNAIILADLLAQTVKALRLTVLAIGDRDALPCEKIPCQLQAMHTESS